MDLQGESDSIQSQGLSTQHAAVRGQLRVAWRVSGAPPCCQICAVWHTLCAYGGVKRCVGYQVTILAWGPAPRGQADGRVCRVGKKIQTLARFTRNTPAIAKAPPASRLALRGSPKTTQPSSTLKTGTRLLNTTVRAAPSGVMPS